MRIVDRVEEDAGQMGRQATRKSTKVRTVAPAWQTRVKVRLRRLLKPVGLVLYVLLFPALIAWTILALVYGWRAGPWILLGP
jgi:hypothetical protein